MALTPEELAASLQYQDELTGLPNRRYLHHYFADKVDWSRAGSLAVLLIDFDSFQQKVNDTYGAAAGDDVLVQFAKRLRDAAPGAVVTRHGGDAFLIVLPGHKSDAAAALAEKVRAALAADPLITPKDRLKIPLTFSAGIAVFPDDAKSGDSLLDAVTRAIYVSKKSGTGLTSMAGQLDKDLVAELDALSTLPCPQYLGRKVELESASAMLDELKQRRPALLFVQGEGGTGKSRFLREFADRSRASGILYLYVCCSEEQKLTPAAALLHLIDRFYVSRVAEHDHLRSKLNAPQRAVMRDHVPAFGAWKSEGVIPGARERKLLMLQAVESAVVAMTEKAPLLVLIDNAAHADRGTLDILRVILRDRKAAIGVLFAFKGDVRSIDARRHAGLADFVSEFEKQQRMDSLSLVPLQREHLVEMIRLILPGAELTDTFIDTLVTASKGSPLYIEEAVRALVLLGRIRKTGVGWDIQPITGADMAGSLDAVIQSVLDKLPEGTGEVITNAAVVGTQFDVSTLQEVMGKREAAMYDAMDRARASGLIRHDREGTKEHFEFSADHTRTVRYASTPEETKQKIHRRVADVLRVRNITNPDVNAAPLVFHQARSKGEAPPTDTAEFEAKHAPSRQARISEATTPLSADGMKHAVEMTRALTGLLKIGRLYPQWSQTADSFRTGLQSAVTALLADSPTVTFTVTTDGLRINGQVPDAPRTADAIAEVERLLADRLVGSLTMRAGLEPRELQVLTAVLAAPLDKSAAPPDFWDRLLDGETIANFDVLQRRYISRSGEHKGTVLIKERALNAEELDFLWGAVRFLKAGVDNLRMYPPGHALVEGAMADATANWEEVLNRALQVTLSAPEGTLIVNSTPVDPKTAADAATLIADEIKKKDIKSITLEKGITADEIRALVSVLSVPDAKTANAIVAGGELHHVSFGARTYQRLSTGETQIDRLGGTGRIAASDQGDTAMRNVPSVESIADIPASRIDLRARAWLGARAEKFVSETAEREFIPLVDALNYGAFADLAIKMIDRLGRRLAEGLQPIRRRAVQMTGRALSDSVGETWGVIMTRLRKALQAALVKESDAEVLRTFVPVIEGYVRKCLHENKFNLVGDLCFEALKPKLESKDCPREFKLSIQAKLHGLPEAIGPVISGLKNGPPHFRDAAVRVAGFVGPVLVPQIVEIICDSDGPETRKAGAFALREIGAAAQSDLVRLVLPTGKAEVLCRILSVLELAGNTSIATAVLNALQHADAGVREAALGLVRRLERPLAVAIMRKILSLDSRERVMEAMGLAREQVIHDLVPDIARIAQATLDDDVARVACLFLGECPSPVAIQALRRVFEHKAKMLGLVKGFADETRAAAVSAAARIPLAAAREIVAEAKGDRSDIVKRAAR